MTEDSRAKEQGLVHQHSESESAPRHDGRTPVEYIPGDRVDETPVDGVALCLSGGGYRAMLFHLGALWRLNELGILPTLDRISSVSGGSITAGVLASKWAKLGFNEARVATNFGSEVVDPIRGLASRTIDVPAILLGILPWTSASSQIASAYRRHLYGEATLQDITDRPTFIINSTSLQSGALWRFTKRYTWDYRVGKIENPLVLLARAVAASSAFPPFLSPARFKFKDADFKPGTGLGLQRPPYTTRVRLTDGGVYDNLGLETAWKRCRTVLVSDAGGGTNPAPRPPADWILASLRVENLVYAQVGSLRKRQLIASYVSGARLGTYWGIWSDIDNYQLSNPLPVSRDRALQVANTPTRLKALPKEWQERIVNWGYAITDAAIRKHLVPKAQAPAAFPYPVGV